MSVLKGRKVLITGGTGFIGKFVVHALEQAGAEVICLTRSKVSSENSRVTYLQCDLLQLDSLPDGWAEQHIGTVDYFVYMAASIPPLAKGRENFISAKMNNLDPLVSSLERFGALTEKIVFTSSIDVYGVPEQKDFTEDTIIAPVSTYAVAKYCCEKYLETYCRMNGKKHVTLRYSQVYGPAEPLVRVTPFVIDAIRHDKEFALNGSGKDLRRFLYAGDAAESVLLAMQYENSGIFNIAGGEDVSLLDLIGAVEKVWQKRLRLKQINVDREPVHLLPSFEKARIELKYRPRIDLATGLSLIRDSFSQNK